MNRLAAVVILAAALAPANATAAKVDATDDTCAVAPGCVGDLDVKAAGSERNDLTIVPDGDGLVLRDAATPLVAGRNCVARDDGSVRCQLSKPIQQVQIQTGDGDSVVRAVLPGANLVSVIFGNGDDRIEAEAKEVWANGSDGDDTLIALGGTADFEGRKGEDTLVGGAANDELSGGPGRDRVTGGDGDDEIRGADGDYDGIDSNEMPAGDEIAGGAGRDIVSYIFRDEAVRIDLADPAPDGAPGEGDVLRGIEDLRGGEGNDRLYGDAGPNRLFGGDGQDELRGRAGDDFLSLDARGFAPFGERADGGAGNDDVRAGSGGIVVGGSGADVLRGARDTKAVCGTGLDVLRPRPGQSMGMARDCERWAIRYGAADDLVVATPPRRNGREVGVNVSCPSGPVCSFTLTVATPSGRRIARDTLRVRYRSRGTIDVRVPAALARRALRVFVRVSDGDADAYALGGGVIATPR